MDIQLQHFSMIRSIMDIFHLAIVWIEFPQLDAGMDISEVYSRFVLFDVMQFVDWIQRNRYGWTTSLQPHSVVLSLRFHAGRKLENRLLNQKPIKKRVYGNDQTYWRGINKYSYSYSPNYTIDDEFWCHMATAIGSDMGLEP